MRRLALVVLPLAAVALLGLPLAAGGDGTDEPGFLGFHLEPNPLLSPDRRASIHTEGSEGSVVAVLTPGGPAEVAGLRLGDRVVELGGKTVPDPQTITPKDRASHHEWRVAIRELLEGARAGETVTVVALRGGQRVPVKVTAISEAALRRLQLPEGGAVTIPAPTDAGTPLPLALDLGASVGPLPQ
jgi:S1-C subfamily serine protease